MTEKLTLAEISAKYKKSPKTFSRHVKALGIPHEPLGRSMMFDAGKVSAFLEALAARKHNVVQFRLPVQKKERKLVGTVESKFAEAL